MAARGEAQADVEVSTLVVPAWRLRWRAPELALVLGERAVALASTRRDEIDRLRAESLVVFASNRMGRGVRIADRALDALKAAETAGEQETAWRLRIELAACATAVGAPLTGFGAVRPVLAADGVPHALRAAALVQASDCLVTIGRGPQLGMALSEADQLYVADTLLDADTRLLQRGLLHASAAAQHRRWGDLQAATDAAGKGLELLAELTDPSVDSGQVRGRLTLELVCALMDSNRLGEASEIGSPLLDLPVRAPSAADVGWLRLALATRVHLPAGRVDVARGMLRDTADSAQRHQLDTLLAESLLALAHVHEVSGELAEALTDLRSAHAAERRRARAVYAVRARLAAEFSGAHRHPVGPHEQLGSLLRPGDGRAAAAQGAMRGSQPPADAVLAPELKQQLRQWRPTQTTRTEGQRVKRTLRAAEDMTVEGISAARAHAADRWRLVQPFGEAIPPAESDAPEAPTSGGRRRAEDRPDASTDSAGAAPAGDGAVPAAGLIAAAGAMRSGRRRAAREAAEEDAPALPTPQEEPAAQTPSEPAPDQEPDQEVANVLETLEAAGLLDKRRSGGRRRAPDAEDDATQDPQAAAEEPGAKRPEQPAAEAPAPKWRVEPPQRPRPPEQPPQPPPANLFDAPTMVQPAVGADGLPVARPNPGLGAAFVKGPVIPPARSPQSPQEPQPRHPGSGLEPPRPPEPPRSAAPNDPAALTDPGAPIDPGAPAAQGPGTEFPPRLDGSSATGTPTSGAHSPDALPESARWTNRNAGAGAPPGFPTTPGLPDSGPLPGQPPRPGSDIPWAESAFGAQSPQGLAGPQGPNAADSGQWADGGHTGAHGSPTNRSDSAPSAPADGAFGPHSPQTPATPSRPGSDRSGTDSGQWPTAGASGGPASNSGADSWADNAFAAQGPAGPPGPEPDQWSTGPSSRNQPGMPGSSGGTPSPGDGGSAGAGSGGTGSWGDGGFGAQPPQGFPGMPGPSTDAGSAGAGSGGAGSWADGGFGAQSSQGQPGMPGSSGDAGSAGAGRAADSGRWDDEGPGSESRPGAADQGRGVDGSPTRTPGAVPGAESVRWTNRPSASESSQGPAGVPPGLWTDGIAGLEAFGAGLSDGGPGSESARWLNRASAVEPPRGGAATNTPRWSDSDPDPVRQADTPPTTGRAPGAPFPPGFGGSSGVWPGPDTSRVSDSPSGAVTGAASSHTEIGGQAAGTGDPDPDFAARSDFDTGHQADRAFGADAPARSGFDSTEPVGTSTPEPLYGTESARVPDPVNPTPEPEREPDQVPAVPDPDDIPDIPIPDPIPRPPTSSGFDLGRSRFLSSADVEDDLPEVPAPPRRPPVEEPEPVPEEPVDPFVTAVVVGDRTIEVPSAARASRRHKSDLSLAELLTEALVAYETGRRSDPEADQTASEEIADWISSSETPAEPISPDRLERAGHRAAEPAPEPTDSEKTTYLTPVRDVESTALIWEPGPDGEPEPPYDRWTLPES
ncbi:hypothetical protein [Umezawaea tangerina]|uniref:Uncharacterized protein n=1 Tax=Umezawaea tangerina TaxID=84725 RepID=A0A2T0SSC3_9PSEU|nr:hypothetical protein [Umezawaea tangerina]PRY36315.1 hypothetical protein CLV43_112242 [Umezawaea tangerina]